MSVPAEILLRVDCTQSKFKSSGILEKQTTTNISWFTFLKEKCGLDLKKSDKSMAVCSGSYRVRPYDGPGWVANLEEKISTSLKMYKRILAAHTIRLIENPRFVRVSPVEAEFEDYDFVDDEASSQGTSASQEESELNEEGIIIDYELKENAIRTLKGKPNAMFLKAQDEIQKLRRHGRWDNIVRRAPICSYLLDEMFR